MARIRNYVTDNNITDQDIVVGSDGDNSGVTKNFNVSTLKQYISNVLVEEAPIDGVTYSRKDGEWIATSLSADEIIEVETYGDLPNPGSTSVLYVTLNTGQLWIWEGSYVEVSQGSISPFSTITEGGNVGIARTGRNSLNYGNIGVGAVDLSLSDTASSTLGATGQNSFATGRNNEASGFFSSAQGNLNKSTGVSSSTFGGGNTASGTAEMAIGIYGTSYTSTGTVTDRLFNVGAGTSSSDKKDAFTIFKNLAAKFKPTALSSITNQIAGFFIFDSSDSNRPAIHNGTAWKKLAYQDDVASITIDSIPTDGSSNAVSSNGTFDALALKADLVSGKVPSSQLPSYVDDVVEVANFAALPLTGETGKLYITIDTGFVYRWTGTVYVQIATGGSVTSVGLTMPSAFSVSNSPITSTGDIAVTAAGTTAEYIRGDGTLATLPVVPTKTSDLINDGDNGTSHFISLEDLPSTLTVYPTTVASGIGGYNKLVSSITDPDYNTTAVDVSTGAITGTAQLIAGLITDENQIVGNPGVFNMTTIGNIRRTGGSGQAEFFFRVYKRDSGGTETLILQSNNTQQITSAIYAEFFANGLWNDGIFVSTDRIVIKFYGTKVGSGSNPTYDFQFGGSNPVRSIIPVPLNVIPSGGVPLTREEFSYTSSQDFTLSGTPSFIYAVFVQGQELDSDQYSSSGTTLTILNTLGASDSVNILYTPTSSGFLEYYTKAQIDGFLTNSNIESIIGQASSSNNGYLSSTDWIDFDAKQDAITLTTNNYSGVATFSGGTLNIPNYEGFIPKLRGHETFRGVNYSNNSTTEVTSGGITIATTGSTIARSVASTNYASKQVRKGFYGSTVSAGRYTGTRGSALLWFMGGGFKYVCDVYISDTAYGSGCRQFYGMAGQTTDLAYSDSVLVSSLVNIIGVGSENGDANLQIFHNDATGTATKVDLGVNFPANRTAGAALTTVYSIELYNDSASTEVKYCVRNKETESIAMGTISTNLPLHTQGLNFFASRCMGAGITNTGQFDLLTIGTYSL